MTDTIRDTVIRALDRATGLLNVPETARMVMGGGDLAFDTLELDSLTNLEMIMEIEDSLGIELNADEVAAHATLSALVAYITSQIPARAG